MRKIRTQFQRRVERYGQYIGVVEGGGAVPREVDRRRKAVEAIFIKY